MKKLIFLISTLLFAQTEFLNPFESNSTNIEKNLTVSKETNISLQSKTHETNKTNSTTKNSVKIFKDSFATITPDINIAIVINKQFFKRYLNSIINSINAYFLYKNTNYSIKVYDETNLSKALNNKYILYYSIKPDIIYSLGDYTNNFYLPIINRHMEANETNATNIYFGGIDYKNQLKKLFNFVSDKNIIVINSNTYISQILFNIEKKNYNTKVMRYPDINYKVLNNSYVLFNTSSGKTGQILSNIVYNNIQPTLELSTQINYDPLLISITQPQDIQKLILANSILNIPAVLEDYNQLLYSNIKFNWLNYSATLLANKIYNTKTQGDEFYLNDFRIYMFNNQINYKTRLYQIINNSFKSIY